MNMDRRILMLGGAAAGLVLVTGSLWLSRGKDDPYAGCRKSAMAGGFDQLGGPFTLTDQTGARVSSEQVFAKPALLYFGYTYCPDVCPLDSARNAEAVAILQERGIEVTPVGDRTGFAICQAARRRGVWVRPLGDVVVLMPPLAIERDDVELLTSAVIESIDEVLG